MWKRGILVGLGGLIFVLLMAGLTWYLAFFAGPRPPTTLVLPDVQNPLRVTWTENGPVEIDALSEHDALIGLGYGMGRSRTWQLVLWRTAALGNLSSIFGEDAIEVDRLARQLQLGDLAKQEAASLPIETGKQLRLLTTGLNAALLARDTARHSALLLLGVEVEPWETWHSLAIERLFEWISWNPFSADDTSATAKADRTLRELLQIDGFEFNTITSSFPGSSSFIAARYATGRTSVPFYLETEISTPDRRFFGLFVPGTFIAPMGHTSSITTSSAEDNRDLSWAFLLRGNAYLTNERVPPHEITLTHSRIETEDREDLVQISRWRGTMPLIHSVREASSGAISVLHWTGFNNLSDTAVWIGLLQGKMGNLSLIRQDGVYFENGNHVVMGTPEVAISRANDFTFLASSNHFKTPEDRFLTLKDGINVADLLTDTFNESAAQTIPSYLERLPDSLLTNSTLVRGIPYLTNWNYEYDTSEIGASIFELMMRSAMTADSTLPGKVSDLLGDMQVNYGSDMSAWRWENVQERRLFYPGSSLRAPDAGRPEASFLAKYQPIVMGGAGHPQTFVWGSAYVNKSLTFSSAWEGAVDLNHDELLFRRPYIDYSTFLGAFISSDRPIELNRMSEQLLKFETRIIPLQASVETSQ